MTTSLPGIALVSLALLLTAGPAVPARPDPVPPPSVGHALVYHDGLRAVLLFNAGLGAAGDTSRTDERSRVWAWRGERWELVDSMGPPLRNLAGVAYDRGRDVVVMHGGTYTADVSYDETWEWRPSGWTRFSGAGPGVRHHTQMVYHDGLGGVVLFGGADERDAFPTDLWWFDGARWERLETGGAPARVHHALAYDPVRDRLYAIGGFTPGATEPPGTWAWSRTGGWSREASLDAARSHAPAAFDASRGRVMLFGGMANRSVMADFLTLAEGRWSPIEGAGPPARFMTGLAWDRFREVLVLFGGGTNSAFFDDTWEWDGRAWTRRDSR